MTRSGIPSQLHETLEQWKVYGPILNASSFEKISLSPHWGGLTFSVSTAITELIILYYNCLFFDSFLIKHIIILKARSLSSSHSKYGTVLWVHQSLFYVLFLGHTEKCVQGESGFSFLPFFFLVIICTNIQRHINYYWLCEVNNNFVSQNSGTVYLLVQVYYEGY